MSELPCDLVAMTEEIQRLRAVNADLLAACKALVALMDGDEDEPCIVGCHCTTTDAGLEPGIGDLLQCPWCQAKDAIARAEGGQT